MSVRVVARVRPLLKSELEKDIIVTSQSTSIKIPNPKHAGEEYSFQFNSVYGQESTQQEIYDTEVTPTIKHLFQGYDVTLFAYGTTGAGKTHTMKGGKSLADRGVIPRLLSGVYRKSRLIEKSSNGETTVNVCISYYEIYCDKVFDLLQPPEKRTATGLPIREAEGGKAVVVGLTEVEAVNLKEFEVLYDKANTNRSTGATRLNASSSRSHAILCVKITISSPTETRVSTVSAIDLAGSEDNRRTGNGKERMIESASINKSLFVLAQCVEAISKKQARIPYRESKMTRILSLGQNNGFTVMILNLSPVRSFHLDTLSSLNFANRTKKVEIREIENEPVFKGPPRQLRDVTSGGGLAMQRQPLRPLHTNANLVVSKQSDGKKDGEKPAKQFSVYSDRGKVEAGPQRSQLAQKTSPLKRPLDTGFRASSRPSKMIRPSPSFLKRGAEAFTKAQIESLVEQKVSEALAARAMDLEVAPPPKDVSEEVQKRLDSIEKRLQSAEGERAEGLNYLFMAKQHQARGENGSALKMYELARPHFPNNEKLARKIESLKEKLAEPSAQDQPMDKSSAPDSNDESYRNDNASDDNAEYSDEENKISRRANKSKASRKARNSSPDPLTTENVCLSPRSQHLLDTINGRELSQIKTLSGLGPKRAEGIIEFISRFDEAHRIGWHELQSIKGLGKKTLESMRQGIHV